jgi:hypothetical protein
VRLADGAEFRVENLGPAQTVYDGEGVPFIQTVQTPDGPEPVTPELVRGLRGAPRVIVRRRGGGFLEPGTEALLAIFAARSVYNSRNRTTVLDFRAEDYMRGEEGGPKPAIRVGELTEKEVHDVCERYEDTKEILDDAVDKAHKDGDYARGPAIFGTRVHKIMQDEINGKGDPNWKAEVSLDNIPEDDPRLRDKAFVEYLRKNGLYKDPHYGKKGSIRADSMDYNPETKTMCMPDVKTGKERFGPKRMHAMVLGALLKFPEAQRFIIFEMRPTRMPAHR